MNQRENKEDRAFSAIAIMALRNKIRRIDIFPNLLVNANFENLM